MQFRRRVPRQPAGWTGVCQIGGEFAARCRVIDISMLGVGITLDHPSPYVLVGRHISVDVPAVGDSASIRLEGKITNARLTLRTTVRVGIEFDSPSADLVSKVGGHAKAGVRRIRVDRRHGRDAAYHGHLVRRWQGSVGTGRTTVLDLSRAGSRAELEGLLNDPARIRAIA